MANKKCPKRRIENFFCVLGKSEMKFIKTTIKLSLSLEFNGKNAFAMNDQL